ncbi:MAG: cytochrome d ubiquinol oxidase subunit II [Candidatus Saccharibacteria bacterium]
MTDIIILVLGVAVLLYVLLGGADFGAGIIELVTKKRGVDVISKAIAPVWEANHIWLILAIVILFNGFPLVFTTVTTYLHIPLFIVLLGIVFRGSAFTFRYYDISKDNVQKYYNHFFRISSLITPFFLGMVLGAIILGKIPENVNGSFYEIFIAPWLNLFTVTTGIFVTLLFGWLAAIYLIGETDDDESYITFSNTSRLLFMLLIVTGAGVFLMAEFYGLHFLKQFLGSPIAIGCIILATVLIPYLWKSITRKDIFKLRLLAGIETACIIAGWFAIQFPVMVYIRNGHHLTIWNSQAPESTMDMLFYALIVGVLIIIPSFIYLFKVFKFNSDEKALK